MQISNSIINSEKVWGEQLDNIKKDPLYFIFSVFKNSQKLIPLYFDEKKWKQLENEGFYKFFTTLFTDYIFRKPDPALKCPTIDYTEKLSDDMLKKIFSFLSPKELARICSTCKRWNQLVSNPYLWDLFDLEKLFPGSVFLGDSWLEYFGQKVEIPKYDKRLIIAELYRPCPFVIDKRKHQTHILVLMPEGLTIESLKEQAKGRFNLRECFWNPTIILENKPKISKTCINLITKMIIPETIGKPLLINKETCFGNSYEVPDVLTAIVANLFRQKITKEAFKYTLGDFKKGKQNFLIKLWNIFNNFLAGSGFDTRDHEVLRYYQIFTICKEEFKGETFSHLVFLVGGVSPDKLQITHALAYRTTYDERTGITPMKLVTSKNIDS